METALELKNISYIFPDCKGITDMGKYICFTADIMLERPCYCKY